MDADCEFDDTLRVAATVAPEDLRRGDYVAVLNRTCEVPSFLWCCGTENLVPEEPVRMRWKTREGGLPLKIKAVCLPFVFLKTPRGRFRSIDLRQVELVRLDPGYARLVWKKLRQLRKSTTVAAPRR